MAIWGWSKTASSNATADSNINWQEGQNPSTVNDSSRAMMAAIKAGFDDIAGVSALGGSGNTFTLALSQSLPSLVAAVVGFVATRSNTGAVTLNVDSKGAKPLRFTSGTNLASGEIISGQYYICAYNAGLDEWLITSTGAVPNARLASMANGTVKANVSGSSAAPSDVTLSSLASAMAFAGAAFIPAGVICMWSGTIASIPVGWALCDGANSTPDLRDKFVIGARADNTGQARTNVTGSYTQSGGSKDATNVSHTHTATVTDPGHTHDVRVDYSSTGGGGGSRQYWANSTVDPIFQATKTDRALSDTTGVTVSNSLEGASATNANLPPYFALAYIMKT